MRCVELEKSQPTTGDAVLRTRNVLVATWAYIYEERDCGLRCEFAQTCGPDQVEHRVKVVLISYLENDRTKPRYLVVKLVKQWKELF